MSMTSQPDYLPLGMSTYNAFKISNYSLWQFFFFTQLNYSLEVIYFLFQIAILEVLNKISRYSTLIVQSPESHPDSVF